MIGARGRQPLGGRVAGRDHRHPDAAVGAGGDVVGHGRAGWPTNGVTVPACGPVSQYFDSRRPWVSANTSADPSAVSVTPLAKYSPSHHGR